MKPNPVVHFEMPYKDAKRASEFYSKTFGWEMKQFGQDMGNYIVAQTTKTDEKGMVQEKGNINGGLFPHDDKEPGRNITSVVISVDDINVAMKDIEASGGKIVSQPQEIPKIGMWAVFTDTEGNRLSILQPAPMGN